MAKIGLMNITPRRMNNIRIKLGAMDDHFMKYEN
jgi:hypothetical protein